MSRENYNDNVFINCPFDNEYQKKFHAIVCTILRCGLIPHCALEHDDASENRIDKLYRLISFCRFGVHDILNTNLGAEDNLPRFNMPFELGVFLAAKKFGSREQKRKLILVFEKNPFLYVMSFSSYTLFNAVSGQTLIISGNLMRAIISSRTGSPDSL